MLIKFWTISIVNQLRSYKKKITSHLKFFYKKSEYDELNLYAAKFYKRNSWLLPRIFLYMNININRRKGSPFPDPHNQKVKFFRILETNDRNELQTNTAMFLMMLIPFRDATNNGLAK